VQVSADAGNEKEADESWRTQDPFAFLPAPQENSGVHEEITLSDGTILRFKNTPELLKAHLEATKSGVCLHCSLSTMHSCCICR
jgi:glutaminyl-tRNA synthetase